MNASDEDLPSAIGAVADLVLLDCRCRRVGVAWRQPRWPGAVGAAPAVANTYLEVMT